MTTQSKTVDRKLAWRTFLHSPYDWLLISGLIGLLPLMVLESQNLSQKKHLQFFPLAWVGFVAIAYLRASLDGPLSKPRRVIGGLFLAIAFFFGLFSVFRFSPWGAHLSVITLTFGWFLLRAVGNRWTELVAWISVLAITLPLPLNLDSLLIRKLQSVSTSSASSLLDLTATPFVARGNVLEVRTGELFVDEACSGVDSLYSLAAIAIFLVVWNQTGFLSALIMIILVPMWAWLGNLFRLFTIVFMLDRFGIDLSHDWPHTALGMLVFAISFGCLMLSQQATKLLLEGFPSQTGTATGLHNVYNWIVRWPGKSSTSRAAATKRPAETVTTSGFPAPRPALVGVCLLFVALGVFSLLPILAIGPWDSRRFTLPSWTTQQISEVFTKEDLPAELDGLKQVDFKVSHRETGSMYGEHSATWSYQAGGQIVQISVDFPFPGFHALEECYMASGKEMVRPKATTLSSAEDSSTNLSLNEVLLNDDLQQESFLYYLNYDINGEPVSNLESIVLGGAFAMPAIAYQVQVYLPDCGPLTDSQRESYQDVLVRVAPPLLEQLRHLPNVR